MFTWSDGEMKRDAIPGERWLIIRHTSPPKSSKKPGRAMRPGSFLWSVASLDADDADRDLRGDDEQR